MFEILVIEDDGNKLTQLQDFLSKEFGAARIRVARSLQSGIRAVKSVTPTIVLLDMTLPNFDATSEDPGGQTHNFGGTEFLGQLDRFEIQVPVIVVTQFITFGRGRETIQLGDLDRDLQQRFPKNYVGCVYYHASIHSWKDELVRLIRPRVMGC